MRRLLAVLGVVAILLAIALPLPGTLPASRRLQELRGLPASGGAPASFPDDLKDVLPDYLAQSIDNLLGNNGPRTYLVLYQNTNELRANGGFIGYWSIVRMNRGKMSVLAVKRSWEVDMVYKAYLKTHPRERERLPYPFGAIYPMDSWYMRDREWSPDFPTTGRDMRRIFSKEARVYNSRLPKGQTRIPVTDVDGVVGIDQTVISYIIGALDNGELILDGTGKPYPTTVLTARNSNMKIQSSEFLVYRDMFMQDLTHLLEQRVGDANQHEQDRILDAFLKGLFEKHIQVYSSNPIDQSTLTLLGWAGELRSPASDFLHVNDVHVGYDKRVGGKTNEYVEESIRYRAFLRSDLLVNGRLGVIWKNLGVPGYFYGLHGTHEYDSFENAWYQTWTRVMLKRDTRIVGHGKSYPWALPASYRVTNDFGKKVAGDLIRVYPGETESMWYRYVVPHTLSRKWGSYLYQLTVQKQAGRQADGFTFDFSTPYFYPVWADVDPQTATATGFDYRTDLRVDRFVQVEVARDFDVAAQVDEGDGQEAWMAVANPSGARTARVSLRAYSGEGERRGAYTLSLRPRASRLVRSAAVGHGAVTGGLESVADGSVAAAIFERGEDVSGGAGGGASAIALAPTVPRSKLSNTLYVPWLGGSAGGSGLKGRLALRNPGVGTARVHVAVRDAQGSMSETRDLTIVSKGHAAMSAPAGTTGASVDVRADRPVVGVVRVSDGGGAVRGLVNAVGAPGTGMRLIYPHVESGDSGGDWVGDSGRDASRTSVLSILNTSNDDAEVLVDFYGRGGALVASKSVELGPHAALRERADVLAGGPVDGAAFVESSAVVAGYLEVSDDDGGRVALASATPLSTWTSAPAVIPMIVDGSTGGVGSSPLVGRVWIGNVGWGTRVLVRLYDTRGRLARSHYLWVGGRSSVVFRPSNWTHRPFVGAVVMSGNRGALLGAYYEQSDPGRDGLGLAEAVD